MYESGVLRQAIGGSMHPGGVDLTERMLSLCDLPDNSHILDIGCGTGVTVEKLLEAGFHAVGLDHSKLLLHTGLTQSPDLPLSCGSGNSLPIATGQIDAVLAECSLSAMSNARAVLSECWRVLCKGGKLALSDVYARNPEGLPAIRALPLSSGLHNAMSQDELVTRLKNQGLKVLVWEDHSDTLKHLAAQMIFSQGSMCEFWRCSEPAVDPMDIQIAISKAKLGYYLLVAMKP